MTPGNQRTRKDNSRTDRARGQRVLEEVLGGKWNGRLTDDFMYLRNNVDKSLLDLTAYVEEFKTDTWRTKHGRQG